LFDYYKLHLSRAVIYNRVPNDTVGVHRFRAPCSDWAGAIFYRGRFSAPQRSSWYGLTN
jgi:hypothetical protein